jgi:hypothetical protein
MNKLQSFLTKRPPELMKAADILVQSHSVSTETALDIIRKDFMPCIDAVYTMLDDLKTELSNNGRISENKLATYFLANPAVLDGFEVIRDEELKTYRITYLGSDDKLSITDGYNKIMKQLIKVFGFKDLSFQTISNALIRAYCWYQDESQPDQVLQLTSESCIIDIVRCLDKQFTIPDIKKQLPDLSLSTKQIENILLLNGFSFKQYGTSRKKYFYREFH